MDQTECSSFSSPPAWIWNFFLFSQVELVLPTFEYQHLTYANHEWSWHPDGNDSPVCFTHKKWALPFKGPFHFQLLLKYFIKNILNEWMDESWKSLIKIWCQQSVAVMLVGEWVRVLKVSSTQSLHSGLPGLDQASHHQGEILPFLHHHFLICRP